MLCMAVSAALKHISLATPADRCIQLLMCMSGGIGTATGRRLRAQGARLAILYAPFEASRREALLHDAFSASELEQGEIQTYECDISSPASVQNAFSGLENDFITTEKMPRSFPSMLINTAGYVSLAKMEDTPPEETLKNLHTNVLGPMLTSQAFAKLYFRAFEVAKDSPSPPPPGRIVNISSQAAHVALHLHSAYCASKAGLNALTRSMASEWGPRGITANSISPTVVWTEMGKKAWADDTARNEYLKQIPTSRFALPDEIASAVDFLCQDSSGMVNGADLRVDGGFTIR